MNGLCSHLSVGSCGPRPKNLLNQRRPTPPTQALVLKKSSQGLKGRQQGGSVVFLRRRGSKGEGKGEPRSLGFFPTQLAMRRRRLLRTITVLAMLLMSCGATARSDQEHWKSATATYSKEPRGFDVATGGACGYGDVRKAGYARTSGVSTSLFNRGSTCGGCFELRCVDHILWCLQGSPSTVVTATDFCPPNYGLPGDYGGWCNYPREHLEMSELAFAEIADRRADIVPVQYRRVDCERNGGVRFTASGSSHFCQVLITNVGADGEVVAVKVKGSRTGWIPMGRNWGQNWECSADLRGQPLSFEVTTSRGTTVTSYGVASASWHYGQTFEGKQFQQ